LIGFVHGLYTTIPGQSQPRGFMQAVDNFRAKKEMQYKYCYSANFLWDFGQQGKTLINSINKMYKVIDKPSFLNTDGLRGILMV